MASLTTYTIDVVDGYWAGCLGCPHEMLRPSHTFVIPHADELLDYAGIFILRLGNAPIVSLPHGLYPWLGPTAERWSAFDVLNATHLHSVFGTRIDKIIGPAFIGYTDHAMFHAGGGPSACLLGEKDQACVSARSFAVYHQARGRQLFISLLSRVEGLVLTEVDLTVRGSGVEITCHEEAAHVFRAGDRQTSPRRLQEITCCWSD